MNVRDHMLALAVLFVAAASGTASATSFCSEPREPYCLSQYGTFEDEWSFNRCKIEVQSFVRQTKTYADCLDEESRAALTKAQKVIEQFNCKAKGGTFCP